MATVDATARAAGPGPRSSSGAGVARLVALAFALSLTYTVVTTVAGTAPTDFDATTSVVWVGYLAGATAALLALRKEPWARRAVAAMLSAFLAAAFLVYPHYFTPPHQDILGWFENDAYVALLALALFEHLRRG